MFACASLLTYPQGMCHGHYWQ